MRHRRLWSRPTYAAALPDRNWGNGMSGIAFRSGRGRCEWAPPVASGWFTGLLMQERADRQRAHSSKPRQRALGAVPHREPSERLRAAWAAIEQTIRTMVDGPTWSMWLADLHPHSLVGGIWTLACPAQKCDWIMARFGRLFSEAACCPVRIVACDCGRAA